MRKASSSYLYFDPSRFSLTPAIPYSWRPWGQTLAIPSAASPRLNILGFMSPPPEPLSDCDRHRDLRDHDCGLGCFCRPNCPRRETPLQQGRESLQFGELDHRLIRKVAHRVYQGLERQWLRWYDAEQAWIPTPVERE